jgi:hypothetical protein
VFSGQFTNDLTFKGVNGVALWSGIGEMVLRYANHTLNTIQWAFPSHEVYIYHHPPLRSIFSKYISIPLGFWDRYKSTDNNSSLSHCCQFDTI